MEVFEEEELLRKAEEAKRIREEKGGESQADDGNAMPRRKIQPRAKAEDAAEKKKKGKSAWHNIRRKLRRIPHFGLVSVEESIAYAKDIT